MADPVSALDVIDTQADLSQAMLSREYALYVRLITATVKETLWALPKGVTTDDVVRSEAARLRAAHSYHVNADMSALVHAATHNLADDQSMPLAFHPENLPTEQGFAMFDGLKDDAFSALSWGPVTEKFGPDGQLSDAGTLKAGLRITGYSGGANHPMFVANLEQRWASMADRLVGLRSEVAELVARVEELQSTEDMLSWARSVTPPKLAMIGTVCVPRETTPWQHVDGGNDRLHLAGLAWTLFYFCQQTIATVENEEAHPRTAKRWRKLPIPKMTTVIRLRRSSTPRDGAPTAVEWSHRWLVRGHWRRQRVGPGRSEIRPVWVQGHVKGPEGAPLVVSNHVYDLVR